MRQPYRYHVLPCGGSRCGREQAERLKGLLKELLGKDERKRLGIRISTTSCQGLCEHGMNVAVYPEGIVYHRVTEEDLLRIVREHLRGGVPVEEILERRGELGTSSEDSEATID